jgi:hypothetical protein
MSFQFPRDPQTQAFATRAVGGECSTKKHDRSRRDLVQTLAIHCGAQRPDSNDGPQRPKKKSKTMKYPVTPGWRFPHLAAAAIGMLLLNPSAPSQTRVDSALTALLGTDPTTIAFDLDRLRPAAVPAEFRARVIASLPPDGRVKKLNQTQRAKLASLEPILRLQKRQGVYEFPVYENPQATVGLHLGAAVLISEAALNLLDPEELQALVAHEIGHEYVWAQHQAAEKQKDSRRLKELELFCDGIAILTLRRAGVDPNYLVTALEKVVLFNRTRVGQSDNDSTYPTMDERKKFAQAVMTAGPVSR